MEFKDAKYQHIERLGTDEVLGITDDPVIIQPKIDGTNGLIVIENGKIKVGSRNRFVTPEDDNHGFAKFVLENSEKYLKFYNTLNLNDVIIYGEFTVKTRYTVCPELLNHFFVFDVFDADNNRYLPLKNFTELFTELGINFVPEVYLDDIDSDTLLERFKEFSRFALPSKFDHGEGLVIKRLDYFNQYGRQTWAKILYEKPARCEGLYEKILENWFTDAYIEKETLKYFERFKEPFNERKYSNILISEFFKEEAANIVFKFQYPEIDFGKLRSLMDKKLKYFREHLSPELFSENA